MPIIQTLTSAIHNVFIIFLGLMGIGFLIGFHEFGHFLFCKLFNIKTPSFSIGMGPRILKRKIGETEFVLSAIPLGGYVEIAGSAEVGQGDQSSAASTDETSFARKPYWQKMLVMIGGIAFNLAFAYFALSLLFLTGMPKSPLVYPSQASQTVSSVESDSPAGQAGLKTGDQIVGLNGKPVTNTTDIIKTIQDSPGKSIALTVAKNGSTQELTIPLGQKEQLISRNPEKHINVGYMGVEFEIPKYGIVQSIKKGFATTNNIIFQVVDAFKNILSGKKLENLGGPIAVISETIKGAGRGFKIFMLLLAFISVNLAVLNFIPLPIFDGGQMLYYTIEAIAGRPLPEKVREYIHIATWIAVIVLALYLSVKDVIRIFTK